MAARIQQPVLVTGASGFVGNNLVRQLLSKGRSVRVLVRNWDDESLRGLDIDSVKGDVLQPASLHTAMAGVSTVFHLAGSISIEGQQDRLMRHVNVDGTANVVKACLQSGVQRLVHFSSIHALSYHPKNQPVDETRRLAQDPPKHLAYDLSKAAGEQHVLSGVEAGLNAVILNPVGIFGPNDFGPSPGGEFVLQLMRRKLPGLVQAGYCWVDVRDVAITALAAETKGRRGHRYILSSQYGSFKQIARWVQECSGARPPLFNVPVWVAKQAAPLVVWYSRRLGIRPLVTPEAIEIIGCHQNIVTRKAALELGFQPRPLRETIADTVAWLQTHESNETNVAALPGQLEI